MIWSLFVDGVIEGSRYLEHNTKRHTIIKQISTTPVNSCISQLHNIHREAWSSVCCPVLSLHCILFKLRPNAIWILKHNRIIPEDHHTHYTFTTCTININQHIDISTPTWITQNTCDPLSVPKSLYLSIIHILYMIFFQLEKSIQRYIFWILFVTIISKVKGISFERGGGPPLSCAWLILLLHTLNISLSKKYNIYTPFSMELSKSLAQTNLLFFLPSKSL